MVVPVSVLVAVFIAAAASSTVISLDIRLLSTVVEHLF